MNRGIARTRVRVDVEKLAGVFVLAPCFKHKKTTGSRGWIPVAKRFAVLASVVESVASVHRRIERRKFAVPRPLPEGISASRQIPGPSDGLGFGGEHTQQVAVDGQFVDHISV